jgi:hypothetical protein
MLWLPLSREERGPGGEVAGAFQPPPRIEEGVFQTSLARLF